MDSILEMDIPHSSFTSFNSCPLFFVFGERVEYFIRLFVSYKRSHWNLQNQIFRIRAVLVLGFSWFAWSGFENGFVSIGL